MKVLCIGHTSYDISSSVDEYPQENIKYRLEERIESGGGPASNAAYLLGKWGIDTTIATVVGSDDYAEKIKKEFQSVNVDTNYIETSYEKATSLSFILINKKNGSRTIFNLPSDLSPIKKFNYEFTPDIIYTDGHDYGATQNAISKFPKAIRIIDAGRAVQEVVELCKYMNYIVCSKEFAEKVSGGVIDYNNPQTLVDVYTKLQGRFPSAKIVVTLEEHGAMYVDDTNQLKIMPGLKVEVQDTTGAGDIFHGAFVYGLINGFDMEKMVTIANIAGGLSVQKRGSRQSMPVLSEVLDYYTKKVGIASNQAPVQPQTQVGTPNASNTQNPQT